MPNQLKFTSKLFSDIYERKFINFEGKRLKCVYLVNLIDLFLNKYINYKKDNQKLNAQKLKSVYGANYNFYIKYLIEKQFIYLYKNYSVGLKSKCFRLTEQAKSVNYTSKKINIPKKLNDKILKVNNNVYTIDTSIKNILIKNLYDIDIDYDGASKWINENIDINDLSHTSNMSSITKINNKDLHYSFDTFGRLHTNFTNLKKEIRNNFLSINNNKLTEIDITNSQPFFLYIFMKNKGFENFEGFDLDVKNGRIYDNFLQHVTDENITRKQIKVKIYSVLFGYNYDNKWNNLFRNLYPNVYDWIVKYKQDNKNHKIISHELQGLESDFIFNDLIPSIIHVNSEIKFITIHDSIMIENIYCDEVKKIFLRRFEKFS